MAGEHSLGPRWRSEAKWIVCDRAGKYLLAASQGRPRITVSIRRDNDLGPSRYLEHINHLGRCRAAVQRSEPVGGPDSVPPCRARPQEGQDHLTTWVLGAKLVGSAARKKMRPQQSCARRRCDLVEQFAPKMKLAADAYDDITHAGQAPRANVQNRTDGRRVGVRPRHSRDGFLKTLDNGHGIAGTWQVPSCVYERQRGAPSRRRNDRHSFVGLTVEHSDHAVLDRVRVLIERLVARFGE